MLAARDQENLVHGYQAAAASKPLNQGSRHPPPKTPGAKFPKTPLRVPLNDENEGLGRAKEIFKTNGKSNGNGTIGKKAAFREENAFVTPMGPRNRAPLGMKTTNAKAKAFQTPAPALEKDDEKVIRRSASARKAKPRVSHAEVTKLDVLADGEGLEEREIEYAPPKPIDLPDDPDDLPPLNLSMFEGNNHMRRALLHASRRVGYDGLTQFERDEKERIEENEREYRKMEAKELLGLESMEVPCYHSPECPGEICKALVEVRKEAEAKYQRRIAEIEAEAMPEWRKRLEKEGPLPPLPTPTWSKASKPRVCPSHAEAVRKPMTQSAKARLTTTLTARPKKTPLATNPSTMRHNAATAASKTTIGYAKGRSTSNELHKTLSSRRPSGKAASTLMARKKQEHGSDLAPAEYIATHGIPPLGSDMWMRCNAAGCFEQGAQEEEDDGAEDRIDELFRKMAEEDFELVLQD